MPFTFSQSGGEIQISPSRGESGADTNVFYMQTVAEDGRDKRFTVTFDDGKLIILSDFKRLTTYSRLETSSTGINVWGIPSVAESGFKNSINLLTGYPTSPYYSYDVYDGNSGLLLIDDYVPSSGDYISGNFKYGVSQLGYSDGLLTIRAPRHNNGGNTAVDTAMNTNGTFKYRYTPTGMTYVGGGSGSAKNQYVSGGGAQPWVFSLTAPAGLTSATYNAGTGELTVTGSGFVANAGENNDIDVSLLTLEGEGGITHTLTSDDVEITDSTTFAVTLNDNDKSIVNTILNKAGTTATGGATYNLAAANNWIAAKSGAADLTGNGITVSNVPIPTIASATYDAATGALAVTGVGFLKLAGSNNDIDISTLSITGQDGVSRTLTSTDVEIANSTSFTATLNSSDQAILLNLLNKDGTTSKGGTTYNLAAAEDWAAGADTSIDIADLTNNLVTVSNVPDRTAPELVSAVTSTDGKEVILEFNEPLNPTLNQGVITVWNNASWRGGGLSIAVYQIERNLVRIRLNQGISSGQEVYLRYLRDPYRNGVSLRDLSGNEVKTFGDPTPIRVTNKIPLAQVGNNDPDITVIPRQDTRRPEETSTAQPPSNRADTPRQERSEQSPVLGIRPADRVATVQLDTPIRIRDREIVKAVVGTPEHDAITGSNEGEVLAGGQGKDKIAGGGGPDAFLFETPNEFGKNRLDVATDFSPKEGDQILISREAFSGISTISIATVTGSRDVKTAASSSKKFVYNDKNGMLYFNENGKREGWGNGGEFVKLLGAPEISKGDLVLM